MFAKNGNVSGQTMPAKMTITKYRTKLSACEPANSASSTGLSQTQNQLQNLSPERCMHVEPELLLIGKIHDQKAEQRAHHGVRVF